MKAIIENMPDRSMMTANQYKAIDWMLIGVIDNIVLSNNKDQLLCIMEETRKNFLCKNYRFDDFFHYGFGSSHMWVRQKMDNKLGERLIYVQL